MARLAILRCRHSCSWTVFTCFTGFARAFVSFSLIGSHRAFSLLLRPFTCEVASLGFIGCVASLSSQTVVTFWAFASGLWQVRTLTVVSRPACLAIILGFSTFERVKCAKLTGYNFRCSLRAVASFGADGTCHSICWIRCL